MLKVIGNKEEKEKSLEKFKISIQEKLKTISNNINEIKRVNGNIDDIYPAIQKRELVNGEPICSASVSLSIASDFMVSGSAATSASPGFAMAEFFALAIGQTFATAEGNAEASCTCNGGAGLTTQKNSEKVNFEDSLRSLPKEEIVQSKAIMNDETIAELKNGIQEKIKQIQEEAIEMMSLQKEINEMGNASGYRTTRQVVDGCNIDCTTIAVAFSFSDIKSGTCTVAENNSAAAKASAVGKNIALVFGFTEVMCECIE